MSRTNQLLSQYNNKNKEQSNKRLDHAIHIPPDPRRDSFHF